MALEARRYNVDMRPTGPDSSYRSYARQVYWRNYWCAQGACGNAAVPGTSNHGWGTAVDMPRIVRQMLDRIGRKYGWAKDWSDAPHEWWHVLYRAGVWAGKDPGPRGPRNPHPTLHRGDRGRAVKRAQRHLARWNLGITRPRIDGDFGPTTWRAVKEFQTVHRLKPDGIVGKATWRRLRQRDPLMQRERTRVNRLILLRKRGRVKHREEIRRYRAWLKNRLRRVRREGRGKGKAYWDRHNRRHRRTIITRALGGKGGS